MSLLSDALNGSRRVDAEAVDRAEIALADAEQAHREWARHVVRSMIREGLRRRLTTLTKAEGVVLMAHDGKPVATTTRIGVKRRRSDGSTEHQIEALSVVTWPQLEEYLAMIEAQIAAGLVNREKANRLLSLRARFPESTGPADACSRLGMTVEDFLEDRAA